MWYGTIVVGDIGSENALEVPAMSIPMGFTDDGLPLGLQLIGPWFGEADVLRVGDAYQQRTDWHERVPA